jgi:hypothetical protein
MIPSNDKIINENLAKEILQHYSHKYANVAVVDEPDLQDPSISLGVEVTSDFPSEKWHRIIKKKSCLEIAEDFAKLPVVSRTICNTINIIKQKLGKNYCGFENLELFVFTADISYPDELLHELIEKWLEEQEKQEKNQIRFNRLLLYSAPMDMLWDCEARTKKWTKKELPCGFSRDLIQKNVVDLEISLCQKKRGDKTEK